MDGGGGVCLVPGKVSVPEFTGAILHSTNSHRTVIETDGVGEEYSEGRKRNYKNDYYVIKVLKNIMF